MKIMIFEDMMTKEVKIQKNTRENCGRGMIMRLAAIVLLALCGVNGAWADKTVTTPISGHIVWVGLDAYSDFVSNHPTELFLHNTNGKGGASALKFTLDSDFDASQVISAKIQLYTVSKANNDQTVNVFGFTSVPSISNTNGSTSLQSGNVVIYNYGASSTGRPVFSGTATTTFNTSSLTAGSWTDVDVSTYIKSLTSTAAGSPVYFGMSLASGTAVNTFMGGYGHTYAAKLVITYSEKTSTTYTIKYQNLSGEKIKEDRTGSTFVGESFTASSDDMAPFYSANYSKKYFMW